MATSEDFERQLADEMHDLGLDQQQEDQEESMMNTQEFNEGLGVPEPDQQFGPHHFIAGSLNLDSPEKVTFLDQHELGRPLYHMRFLLDIEDVCKHHVDPLCNKFNVPNKLSAYFRAKIKNISDSGMSKDGFLQVLNVTKKVDFTRKKTRNMENLKQGGNKR